MAYARIAARHFHTDHHEYYVTPADVVEAIPIVAAAYGQPFGNASAIPTYFCAKLAREDGVDRMLGGDGGDELFGGNARYARQYQFSLYGLLAAGHPRSTESNRCSSACRHRARAAAPKGTQLRRAGEASDARALRELTTCSSDWEPQTFLTENSWPASTPAVRSRMMKEVYDSARAGSLINRMLALDLKFTLADNDLPKVTRMCDAAGIDVAFPMLHESVVDFAGQASAGFQAAPHEASLFLQGGAARIPADGNPGQEEARVWPPRGGMASDLRAAARTRGRLARRIEEAPHRAEAK